MLVALGLVAWAAPADATCDPGGFSQIRWNFTEHAPGMPSSADPARTLVDARLDLRYSAADRLLGHVTLAAAPAAESAADLVVVFGDRAEDGSCAGAPIAVVGTHSPEGGAVRDGATLTFDLRTDLPQGPDCAWVAVTGPDELSLEHDRLDGDQEDGVLIVEPMGGLDLSVGAPKRVPVGRWVALRVHVWAPCYVDRVRLIGKGRGLDAKRARIEVTGSGAYRVRLPVRLTRAQQTRVKVLANGFDARGREVSRAKAFIKLRPRR